jgi:CheY-like chemotaxis protein
VLSSVSSGIFGGIHVASFTNLEKARLSLSCPEDLIHTEMRFLHSLLSKLGLSKTNAERHPIRVFLLDDDIRRHEWFALRFKGDFIDVAHNVEQAQEFLCANSYDAIFLDHDLHPEHYASDLPDDERTGYAIASWLASNPELQRASTILVHTRNADGAVRMVEKLRGSGRTAEYVPFPMLAERIKHYWRR